MREDPKHNTTLNDRRWSKNLTEVRSICPHFGIMEMHHVPMDVVYMRECTDIQELKKYQALIYPHPEIMTERTASLLEKYVRQGGNLVLGARTGQKDENGHCVMRRMPGLLAPLTQSAVDMLLFQTL